VVGDVKVENRIGDALVHRIIRAHREGTPWKACILIPLIPGFTFPIDHNDASAVGLLCFDLCHHTSYSISRSALFWSARTELSAVAQTPYSDVFVKKALM
jgi:phospholipase D1/2